MTLHEAKTSRLRPTSRPTTCRYFSISTNKNLCGRDGRTICGPQGVPKSTSVTLAVDEKTLPMATITGRTDRQTDGQTECDAICGPLLGRRAA